MNDNGSSSKTPFSDMVSVPDSRELTSLAGYSPTALAPASFHRFPSLQQLLDHTAGRAPHPLMQLTETPPTPPSSLFTGLLGGRLDVLVEDAAAHPERYDEDMRTALSELGARRPKEMTADERALLDNAVLAFAAAVPRGAPKPAPKPKAPPAKKPALLTSDAYEDSRAPMVDGPGGQMPAYWWLG